jgi:hypothetical protein
MNSSSFMLKLNRRNIKMKKITQVSKSGIDFENIIYKIWKTYIIIINNFQVDINEL